jgi:phospholipid/cholesterol/gamma-HCH transport system substrate-binding protein
VGIFIFFGLAILVAGVLVVGAQRKDFEKTVKLKAIFTDVNGLLKGNNVWFAGVKIGTVKKIEIIGNGVAEVELKVEERSRRYIGKDAKVKIGTDGLIGNRILVIYNGVNSTAPIESGDTLKTEAQINTQEMMGTLEESNKNVKEITSNLKAVSNRLNEGEGTVGKLLTSDTIAMRLQASAAYLQVASVNIERVTSNLLNYTGKFQRKGAPLNELVSDTMLFSNLNRAASEIRQASANAKELTNNLNQASYTLKDSNNVARVLLGDPQAAQQLKTAIDHIESGTTKFDEDMDALRHIFLFRPFFRKKEKKEKEGKEKLPVMEAVSR